MNEYSVHTDSLGSKSDNSGKKSDVEFFVVVDVDIIPQLTSTIV